MEFSEEWNKDRSIVRCIKDAWLIFSLHFKQQMKFYLPVLVLAGMLAAFFMEMVRMYAMDCAIPAYRLHELGAVDLAYAKLVPSWPLAVFGILSGVLTIVACYWAGGRAFSMLRSYAREGAFPEMKGRAFFSADDRKMAARIVSVDSSFVLFLLSGSAIIAGLAIGVHRWFGLLGIPFALYLFIALCGARLLYAFNGCGFKESLRMALMKRWGGFFTIVLLTGIPLALVHWICHLPAGIYLTASYATAETLLMGDVPVVPSSLNVFFFVMDAVGLMVGMVADLFALYALALYVRDC